MFLTPTQTYYSGTQQKAARAPFLILLQVERATIGETCAPSNTYAIVRKVALAQCGHWMMGAANIDGQWRTISGTYGNDGMPLTVDALPSDAIAVPREIYELWNKGDGHNGAGNEAAAMREWARDYVMPHRVNRRRVAGLKAARAIASDIFERTGIVVAVEAA